MSYEKKDFGGLIGMNGLSEKLLANHFALYEGYVKHAISLLEKIPSLGESQEYDELKRRFGWEWNGMRLHELYFENLSKESSEHQLGSTLDMQFIKDFGSHLNWDKDIKAMSKIRGIGWVVVYYDKQSDKLMNTWINEHDTGHLSGCEPIVVIDFFEHAYMLDYGKEKGDYLNVVISHLNWTVIEDRMNKAKK